MKNDVRVNFSKLLASLGVTIIREYSAGYNCLEFLTCDASCRVGNALLVNTSKASGWYTSKVLECDLAPSLIGTTVKAITR